MASWKRTNLSIILLYILVADVRALNFSNVTNTATISAVVLDDETTFSVCVYPISVNTLSECNHRRELTDPGNLLLYEPTTLLLCFGVLAIL